MKFPIRFAATVSFVVSIATTASAGQQIYVGVVGPDDQMSTYYVEEQLARWLHPESTGHEESFTGSSNLSDNDEVCITSVGNNPDQQPYPPNKHLPWGAPGHYRWRINLPEMPRGNINLQIQCGVLKPSSYELFGMPDAIETCAGETGEETFGLCGRVPAWPNRNHIKQRYLPTVSAVAYPSMGASFNLTAFRSPSAFSAYYAGDQLRNDTRNHEVLDGDKSSRIVLQSCQPESIVLKLPITGQVNGLGQIETDLGAGDEIEVALDFPRGHTMDVYCNQYSVKIMGLGNSSTEDDVEAEL